MGTVAASDTSTLWTSSCSFIRDNEVIAEAADGFNPFAVSTAGRAGSRATTPDPELDRYHGAPPLSGDTGLRKKGEPLPEGLEKIDAD